MAIIDTLIKNGPYFLWLRDRRSEEDNNGIFRLLHDDRW